MNDIDISHKNDQEILKIIRSHLSEGYEVWLQRRCTNKFLISTDYHIKGVMDLDGSDMFQPHSMNMDTFSKQQRLSYAQSEQRSDKCSIHAFAQEPIGVRVSMETMPPAREQASLIVFDQKKTYTDLFSLMSPKMQLVDGFNNDYYTLLQNALQADRQGNIKEAKQLLQELVALLENPLDTGSNIVHVMYVEALCTLGLLYSRIGQYSEGKMCLEKCIRQFQIKDKLLLARIYVRLGQNSLYLHSYQKSLDYFDHALKIYEQSQIKLEISLVLAHKGLIYGYLGHFEPAKKLAFAAVDLIKRQVNKEALIFGQLYHIIGDIYYLNDEWTEAIDYFDIAYDIKIQHPQEILSQILTINQIGNCCYKLTEFKKCLEVYELALTTIYSNSEPNTLTEAQVLNNIGLAKNALQMDSKAEFDKAIQIYLIYYKPNHISVKRTLRNMNQEK